MAEYIEREALIKEIGRRKSIARTSFPKQNFCVNDVLHCIYDATTADVVEVVRCKDCRRWGGKDNDFGMCHCLCRQTEKGDFCAYGEAKMDGKGESE